MNEKSDDNHEDRQSESPQTSLDPTEDNFDPLKVLYAGDLKSKVNFTKYDNLAMFESALKTRGISAVGTRGKPSTSAGPSTAGTSKSRSETQTSENATQRRFLPHQMPIKGHGAEKARHSRNLYKHMEEMKGPLAGLYKMMTDKRKIKVYTRKEHGIRGSIIGQLIAYDKHWNLLLGDACEMWKRRKFKFSQNASNLGNPTNCTERLRKLRIKLPETEVKSLDRKYVEIKRKCKQIMITGEHVVLVHVLVEKDHGGLGFYKFSAPPLIPLNPIIRRKI